MTCSLGAFDRPDLPDLGLAIPCCDGVAFRGSYACTCWIPVYDRHQAAALMGESRIRETMCADCAFRPASPERSGDTRYAHAGDGDLDELPHRMEATFYCHQGMRRIVAYIHGTTGYVHRVETDGYYAPLELGDRAYKANGAPAEVCAGFHAARALILRDGDAA